MRRSYVVIVAGQSNAVGYDESPIHSNEAKPIPFAYYEQLYPTTRSAYSLGSQVPFYAPYTDCFQNMRSYPTSCGNLTKGVHYFIAEKLIGFVPEDYELEIWGYAYGGSGVKTGNVGSVDSNNLPSGSTLWGDTGGLTLATAKRMKLHFGTLQPQSKLMAIVWCQGEQDGDKNISVDNYADGIAKTMQTIATNAELKDENYVNPNFKIDTTEYNGIKYPLWVVYPGPQKYWNTRGTFKNIIAWQKANFTNFVDLPEDLQTNDSNASGSKAQTWRDWSGYGFTSSVLNSHYANCFDFIGHKVAKKIVENIKNPVSNPYDDAHITGILFPDGAQFVNCEFIVKGTQNGDIQFKIDGNGNPNRAVTPNTYYWSGSSSASLGLLNRAFNFFVKDGYLVLEANSAEFEIYTDSTKAERVKATTIVRLS